MLPISHQLGGRVSGAPTAAPRRGRTARRASTVRVEARAVSPESRQQSLGFNSVPPDAVKTYSEQIFTEYGVKDTQDPNAHVQRTPDGAQIPTPKMPFRERGLYRHECYYVLKEEWQSGINPFEKFKLAKDPMKEIVHKGGYKVLVEAATKSFEELDTKENADDIDHRLKWLGLFHRRKNHYGRFMMRTKIPNGIVTSEQVRFLGNLTAKYGEEGCADITTRQNFQMRGITLPDVPEILEGMQAVGLSTIQSGLDNVRNPVGSPLAGIDPHEIVDTRPFLKAINDFTVNMGRGNPEIANLPRKWNVCVVGTHDLFEHPHINDLAFVPAMKDGRFGFNVWVGGLLTATRCEESWELDAWVPEDAVVDVTWAVLATFRDYGARQNRQKARMMWLVEQMGVETFRAEVERRTTAGKMERAVPDMIDKSWERRSYFGVHKQKQEGLNWVGCNVPVGRLEPADLLAMADVAEKYGSGEIRLTVEQNIIFPNVPDAKVEAMLKEPLLQKFTPFPGKVMAGLVSCTGNQFCGFGQVETKRNAWQVAEHLESVLDFKKDIRMMWTGCPNTCGQVQVADIGLMGCQVKAPNGEKGTVPGVDVFVGGRIGSNSHIATVTHPSVRLTELLPLLEKICVEEFGATRKAVPTPNPQMSKAFRFKEKPADAKKAPPKGIPKKAGNATHICTQCGYIYNEPEAFAGKPADYTCPVCSAPKSAFKELKDEAGEADKAAAGPGALKPGQPIQLKLVEKEVLSHNTRRFRFSLPNPSDVLGLPVGKHVNLSFVDASGATVSRPYTPISSDDEKGFVDFVIKVYPKGALSGHLDALPIGATVSAEGPRGRITYKGRSVFSVLDYATGASQERAAKHLGMVAGGTGITPMLQVIRAIFKDNADTTQVSLVFANVTEEDILLRKELDEMAKQHPRNFRVFYALDKPPAGWAGGAGFVNADMLRANLPKAGPDTQVLICGPPLMVERAVVPALAELGFSAEQYLTF